MTRASCVALPQRGRLEIWDLHDIMERAVKRAGARKLRWNDWRHTFASHAVQRGVPLNVVQSWMGHSTIGMTMRYAHLAPDASAMWMQRAFSVSDAASEA